MEKDPPPGYRPPVPERFILRPGITVAAYSWYDDETNGPKYYTREMLTGEEDRSFVILPNEQQARGIRLRYGPAMTMSPNGTLNVQTDGEIIGRGIVPLGHVVILTPQDDQPDSYTVSPYRTGEIFNIGTQIAVVFRETVHTASQLGLEPGNSTPLAVQGIDTNHGSDRLARSICTAFLAAHIFREQSPDVALGRGPLFGVFGATRHAPLSENIPNLPTEPLDN